MSSEKLSKYLKTLGVDAKFLYLEGSTATVEEAADQLGIDPGDIAKSVVFLDDEGEGILALAPGDEMVSEEKLASAVGATSVTMASPDEVERLTGFKVGGVPPLVPDRYMKTVIDTDTMEKDKVVAGGGSEDTLIQISPERVKMLSDTIVADIT